MLIPTIAILSWPALALWLFSKLSFERAIIWSVLLSFLFLPQSFGIDLPGIPALTKETLPNLTLIAIALIMAPRRFRLLPRNPIAAALPVLLIGGAFLTALTNQDPVLIADTVLKGLTLYDGLSLAASQALLILPFLIGWQYLATPEIHREILKAFFAVGLVYSALMLFEVRMSPQLHEWVYGYAPHSFRQQVRFGGYRPVVFMKSGLWTGFFAMTLMLMAAALWRDAKASGNAAEQARSSRYLAATGYLGVVLVLSKAVGSILYGIVFLPVVLFLKARTQISIAAVLVLIALSYPILRGGQLVPTDTILGWAESFSADRAESLETRFDNEELLLEHADKRPLFGWGSWGRNRVFNEETGEDASITDGYWVIIIGSNGWVGYIAFFGLLGLPVLALWRRMRKAGEEPVSHATGVLTLLLGINMIEILPNATLPPWTWLIAGAVFGYATRTETETAEQPLPRDGAPARRRSVL